MSNESKYPRDLIGYGRYPVQPNWPGDARIAVQFVLNYEEGGENCVLHGDPASEQFLSEIVGAAAYPSRHMSMESIYEYGSRAGVWRILREFEKRDLPLTVFGVGMAIERHPDLLSISRNCRHAMDPIPSLMPPHYVIRVICCGSNSSQTFSPTSKTRTGEVVILSRSPLSAGATTYSQVSPRNTRSITCPTVIC